MGNKYINNTHTHIYIYIQCIYIYNILYIYIQYIYTIYIYIYIYISYLHVVLLRPFREILSDVCNSFLFVCWGLEDFILMPSKCTTSGLLIWVSAWIMIQIMMFIFFMYIYIYVLFYTLSFHVVFHVVHVFQVRSWHQHPTRRRSARSLCQVESGALSSASHWLRSQPTSAWPWWSFRSRGCPKDI